MRYHLLPAARPGPVQPGLARTARVNTSSNMKRLAFLSEQQQRNDTAVAYSKSSGTLASRVESLWSDRGRWRER